MAILEQPEPRVRPEVVLGSLERLGPLEKLVIKGQRATPELQEIREIVGPPVR
jgi:hypothetical protein